MDLMDLTVVETGRFAQPDHPEGATAGLHGKAAVLLERISAGNEFQPLCASCIQNLLPIDFRGDKRRNERVLRHSFFVRGCSLNSRMINRFTSLEALSMIERPTIMIGKPNGTGSGNRIIPTTKTTLPVVIKRDFLSTDQAARA
jgi:hypothetical protein